MGYFNFWDTYLILKKDDVVGVYSVLVNRDNKKFHHNKISNEQRKSMESSIRDSVLFRKPKEMFEDFPELNDFHYYISYV